VPENLKGNLRDSLRDTPRKVLVVDDDPMNLKIMQDALGGEGFEVTCESSGAKALEKIQTLKPDLLLLDYEMPGLSGFETLKTLRMQHNYVAVVFVSANTEEGLIEKCLEAGADDYIRKPFHFSEFLARVKVRFRIKDLHDQLYQANQRLKELAETDDLTGLFNMRTIYSRIDFELRRAKRYDRRVACVMMDIDHFKEVNDLNDHLFGSFVITELGNLIRNNIRDTDFAARYGGDEFLVVLTETSEKGSIVFTERLRDMIEKHEFTDGKNSIRRTCSFGIAISDPKDKVDAKDIVRKADHALYEAKHQGRNRVFAGKTK